MKAKLPVGIELERVSDQPEAVKASVGEFVHTLIEAVLIVLAVSFVALGCTASRCASTCGPAWWWR
jgi:multidrug efflux pump subunit AcrB